MIEDSPPPIDADSTVQSADEADAGQVVLKQDPHAVRTRGERHLEAAVGPGVRAVRKHKNITVSVLSEVSGISVGMLSKIENGLTSPSLNTLQALSHSLDIM